MNRTDSPRTSRPGKNRCANAWLTMATGGALAESCRPKSRPETKVVSRVPNQPGDTAFIQTSRSLSGSDNPSGFSSVSSHCIRPSGTSDDAAALRTPGTDRMASTSASTGIVRWLVRPGPLEARDEHRPRREPQRARGQRRERPDEEPRAEDQHEAQAHLDDHQAARQAPANRGPNLMAALRQRIGRLPSCRPQGRRRAEQKCHDDECHSRERQDPPVGREIEIDRSGGRRKLADDQPAAPGGEQRPERGTTARQQQALHQQLPHQARAGRPERQPDAQFVPPGIGARQQQVGQVDAGDEQDEPDDGHQREQRSAVLVAQQRIGAPGRAGKDEGFLQIAGQFVRAVIAWQCRFADRRLRGPRRRPTRTPGSGPASDGR